MVITFPTRTVQDYEAIAATVAKTLKAQASARDRAAGVPETEVQLLREAGLLPLVVPTVHGGAGRNWIEAMAVVKTLAKGDSSAAQLYGYHLLLTVTPELIGTPEQAQTHYRETAQGHLFWANAINTRDTRLTLTPEGDHYRANGVKSFCTGAAAADRIIGAMMPTDSPVPILFVMPSDRPGLSYHDDWDGLGQRRTASGSFSFDQVLVKASEVLGPPAQPEGAFATFLGILGITAQTHIFLGIAESAFEAAQAYTCKHSRPWLTAQVEQASQDPYLLRHYGNLWTQLEAVKALAAQATQQVQRAWDKGSDLSHAERGRVAIAASTAKTLAMQTGLTITQQMFELMGARSATASQGFDRYWRDLRTLTLHDPVDYKLQDIGNWVLNGTLPIPSSYS